MAQRQSNIDKSESWSLALGQKDSENRHQVLKDVFKVTFEIKHLEAMLSFFKFF